MSVRVPRLRQASVLVHFHSFSWVATLTSSITRGTQPPNTYILRTNGQERDGEVNRAAADVPLSQAADGAAERLTCS